MVKLALINPGKGVSDTPPLSLALLAACMEKLGHEIKIIDRLIGEPLSVAEDFNPDVVGITGTTTMINDAYFCADHFRSLGKYVVIGGIHASIFPEEALQHADSVVCGEGENVLDKVLKERPNGIVIGTPTMDMDVLPLPAYHLLHMDFYISLLKRVKMSFAAIADETYNMACILTSRGCPWNCTFCHNSFRTLPPRYRSPEKVLEELKFLYDTYDTKACFFIEDNFFSNHKRVKEICSLLKKELPDLIWGANSRVDCINDDILETVADANCKQATFGWESGSQRILDVLNKRTTVEKNYESVKLCNKHSINAGGTVMIGNPTEKREDIIATKKFIEDSHITGGIGICMTTPYPGTKVWDWCVENKRIMSNDWSKFDFHHVTINMTELSDTELRLLFAELVDLAIRKFSETTLDRISK